MSTVTKLRDASTPLPTRRTEAWKYSDLAAALPDTALTSGAGSVIERLAGQVTALVIATGQSVLSVDRFEADALEARAFSADVAAGGTLTRVVIQSASIGVPLGSVRVTLAAGATFRQFIYAEGAKLARMETTVTVEGEGATVELNGVYLAAAGRHADLTSVVTHAQPGGVTRQLIKGAARAGGRGVFQGKILVAAGAKNTDARQNHHALLLEDGAEVFAKPELEIHADDVQCAHDNTVGGLDAAALFYMRQRGIPEAQARALLVEAFLTEAVPDDLPAELHEEILTRLRTGLDASGSGSAP
jgi:Fe-S cluster assembly protein SufD